MLWRGGFVMSDFEAFSEDIDGGTAWLEHHGILGQKWFKKNGPPYPLGTNDHSSGEKSAAKAAGVSVGSDSGKGSIENVKKKSKPKKKKPLTPEEKREQAINAAKSGDKKKIAKNIDDLSTEELRDAAERARLKDQLTKTDPSDQKLSKADKEKQAAIRSGDKATIQAHAKDMSYAELTEAINKMNLMDKLNYVEPPPTTMDKIRDVSQKLGTFKEVAQKGMDAYNVIAKVYNATHKDSQWPVLGEKPKEEKKEDKEKEKTKEAVKEVGKEVKKSLKEQYEDKLEEEKLKYKNEKKFEKWKAKQEKKAGKKGQSDDDEDEEDDDIDDVVETATTKSYARDFDDSSIWNSVEQASANSKPISDDLTPDEEEFLRTFMRS